MNVDKKELIISYLSRNRTKYSDSKSIAFCNSKYMYLMFLYVNCFHLCLLNALIDTLPTLFFKVYFFSRSTFFMDLVYLFDSKNVPLGNSMCRYLMFLHVSFFMSVTYFTDWYLVYPFFTARIFRSVTPQAKIGVLCQAWNSSDFYATGRNVRFFSLAFCTHACLLISRTGILTIFFTVRMFRSVTAYARFFLFRFAYFFHACLLFYAD